MIDASDAARKIEKAGIKVVEIYGNDLILEAFPPLNPEWVEEILPNIIRDSGYADFYIDSSIRCRNNKLENTIVTIKLLP